MYVTFCQNSFCQSNKGMRGVYALVYRALAIILLYKKLSIIIVLIKILLLNMLKVYS